MSDEIVRQMSKWGDVDEEESWRLYKTGFLLMSADKRIQDLQNLDRWLENETRPTREHASMLTRRRELQDIHYALRGAGR